MSRVAPLALSLVFSFGSACNAKEPSESSASRDLGDERVASSAQPPSTPSSDPGPPLRDDGTLYAESELMGTRVSMNVWVGDPARSAQAAAAIRQAFDEIARIEQIASEWRDSSDLSRLNAAAGKDPIEVPRELIDILARAKQISEASDGHFDVTFYAVGELWSFRPGAVPPDPSAVAARLPLVNWRGIELDPPRRRARLSTPGMKVGLGAIAKGYAVDAASRVLRDAGFANHVVEGGGDTYAAGHKAGEPWHVGVQRPDRAGAMGALRLKDKAVVTSGNYMRFFEWEGRRYTHILDPKTGFPILESQSPRSVTCVAQNATDADAFCTALSVMGRSRAMEFVAQTEGLEALIVDHDGSVHLSAGLTSMWRSFDEPDPSAGPASPDENPARD